MVVHLLSFLPSRQAENLDLVARPVPAAGCPRVGTHRKAASFGRSPASRQELDLHYEDGYASTRVTVSDGHAMVVFTY